MAVEEFSANSNHRMYFFVKDGALAQTSKEPKEGFIEYTSKRPDGTLSTSYIKKFKHIEGTLLSVSRDEIGINNAPGVKIYLKDMLDEYVVTLMESTDACKSWYKICSNIDVTRPINISVTQSEYNGKKQTSLWVNQFDSNENKFKFVGYYNTNKNPNGMPPPVENKVKKKWNYDNQETFLILQHEAFFKKHGLYDVIKKLDKVVEQEQQIDVKQEQPIISDAPVSFEDGLPF